MIKKNYSLSDQLFWDLVTWGRCQVKTNPDGSRERVNPFLEIPRKENSLNHDKEPSNKIDNQGDR